MLVAADGAHSKVRQLANISTEGWSYLQQGVVAIVETERPHEFTAWQRFLPDGPIAFLPLVDGRCSIVWSCPTEFSQQLLDLSVEDFNDELTQAIGGTLGRVSCQTDRVGFPLSLMHAQTYVKHGLALVGDAAHVVHPLAGQGANLGLLDAACLAQIVAESISDNRYFFERKNLRKYERWRKGENLLVMSVLDGLKRLFDTDSLAAVRSQGLSIVSRLTPVKNQLIRQGMGLSGDLPAIARP